MVCFSNRDRWKLLSLQVRRAYFDQDFFGESFAAKPGLGSLAVDILLVSEFKPTLKQKIFDERFVFDFVKLFIRKQCSFALQSF